MPEKIKKMVQECSDSEVEHIDDSSTESDTNDEVCT